ncbi:hypothetical protein [Terriglobus sp. RCC_193]|uniref:hypothetical protein n=1 Tax=Terriglobus sp. RCC_193 TaxID=3239218 RepID=UPI00352357FB
MASAKTGNFRNLQISVDGQLKVVRSRYDLTFIPRGTEERREVLWPVRGLERDKSGCFMSSRLSISGHERLFLFLFGMPMASDPGSVLVIGVNEVGEPYKVIESEMLSLVSFTSSVDGQIQLLAKPSFSQVMRGDGRATPYATTYDPFWVYLISPSGEASLSTSKSEAYNRSHYVWAGMKTREDIAVVFRKGSRPLAVPFSQLDKYLGK